MIPTSTASRVFWCVTCVAVCACLHLCMLDGALIVQCTFLCVLFRLRRPTATSNRGNTRRLNWSSGRYVGWLTSIRTVQFSVLLCHPSSLHRTPISPLPSHVTPRHPTFFNLQILQTANSSEPSDGEHTGPPSSWMLDSDSPAQEHRSAASDAVMDTSYSDKGGWHRSERQVGGR